MANWFYQVNGVQQGPVSELELRALAAQGVIAPDTLISNDAGQSAYAKNVRGLIFQQGEAETPVHNLATPFPAPPPPSMTPPSVTPPSMTPPPFSATIPSPTLEVPVMGEPAPSASPPGGLGEFADSAGQIQFMEAATRIPGIALANLGPLLANIVCFILVSWIPWINLGALIGLFGVCAKVATVGGLSPTEVLNPKYRGMLGNYVVLFSLMAGGVLVVLIGLALPMAFFGPIAGMCQLTWGSVPSVLSGIMGLFVTLSAVLAMLSVFVGWLLAPLLVCDRNVDSSEALARSTELMNGNKLAFCGLSVLYGFFFAILGGVCGLLMSFVPLAGIPLLLGLNVFASALNVAMVGYFYGRLAGDVT